MKAGTTVKKQKSKEKRGKSGQRCEGKIMDEKWQGNLAAEAGRKAE